MTPNRGGAKRAAGKAVRILLTAAFAALAVLTVYIMACNLRGEVASVFGVSVVKVVTGSMEPSIHVGDYIILKQTEPENLQEGDVICFYSMDSAIYGKPNTHRIVSVLDDGSFVTKGDANPINDRVTVAPETIIGKFDGKVGFLRWLDSFSSVKKLLLIAVIIVLAGASIYEVRTIAGITSEYREQQKKAEKEKLIREAIDREKQRLYEQGIEPTVEENISDSINHREAETSEPRKDNES